jgi:(p)ppGpp synthase/HD superfamily hydrolase
MKLQDSMPTLERAIQIAVNAHVGQVDKAGTPYILHPLRVMMACGSDAARIVAVLHDVVEDSEWTADMLREEGFDSDILDGLDAVTKREGEEYLDFCRRAASHPLGREVKRADLRDNMDITRLRVDLTKADLERLERYRVAWEVVS